MTNGSLKENQENDNYNYDHSLDFIDMVFEKFNLMEYLKTYDLIYDDLNQQKIVEREILEQKTKSIEELSINLLSNFDRLLLALIKKRNKNIQYSFDVPLKPILRDIDNTVNNITNISKSLFIKSPENKIKERKLCIIQVKSPDELTKKFTDKMDVFVIFLYIDIQTRKYQNQIPNYEICV